MTNLLNTSKTPSKCSVKGCANQTTTFFDGKKQKFYICDECFGKCTDVAISRRVPKSPKNTIKKILDNKQEVLYD